MGCGITSFAAVLLLHVYRHIDARVALPSERTIQRTAAILEDARLAPERSQVCLLQHGSASAVNRRSSIPVISHGNATNLLQRPVMLSPRSERRALAAEGGLSHVGGYHERIGVGRAYGGDIAAPSRRYPPINSSAYFMDAERSLMASFDALHDSIRMHSSEDLQTSHGRVHDSNNREAATSGRDAIDKSSNIPSGVRGSSYAMDADGASTARLALKDEKRMRFNPGLAASPKQHMLTNGKAASVLSWKQPSMSGLKHSTATEHPVIVNATPLFDSMEIQRTQHSPVSWHRGSHAQTDTPRSTTHMIDAETALTASLPALQDSIEAHQPEVLLTSRERSSDATNAMVWTSHGDTIGRPSQRLPLVNASLNSVDTLQAPTPATNLDVLHSGSRTRDSVDSRVSLKRRSSTQTGIDKFSGSDETGRPSKKFHAERASLHNIDAESALTASFHALQDSIKAHTLSAANRSGPTNNGMSWNSGRDVMRRPSQRLLSLNSSIRSPATKEVIRINSSALHQGVQKHHPFSTLSALHRNSNNIGRSSQKLSLGNHSTRSIGAEEALTAKFNVPAGNVTMYRSAGLPTLRTLFRRHASDATHGVALVNSSIPSMDAESALKASFVAIQNSMKMQQSLKWKQLDLQRKAKAAEWEAAQTKAADERLLQQDMLIRQEDMRLRRQDEELRTENKRLQQLVSQLTKADSEGRQAHQGSPVSAWEDGSPEVSLLLSALLESRAESAGITENTSRSTISNDSREAAIELSSTSEAGGRSLQTEKTIVLAAGALGLFLAWVIFHVISFFVFNAKDEDGDGKIDFADFEEHMAGRVCCGLGASSAKGIFMVLIIAAAGFAFLWSQNIIQPFLKELLCYVYLGGVVLMLVGVVLAELWEHFKDVFLTQIQALGRLMSFLKIDTGDINMEKYNAGGGDVSERPKSQFACC